MTRRFRQGQSLRTLRNTNATALLAAVWDRGPISRTELARITGLAPSSITRLARGLEQAGLIHETSKGKSSGGRQPVLLELAADAALVASLDLSGLALRGTIMDTGGRALVSLEQPFGGPGPELIVQQAEGMLRALLADPVAGGRRIAGIGVSVPGAVQRESGVVDSTNLQLHNFPLGARLNEALGLPVYVEHDTAAAALAEKYHGAGRGVSDLIYLTVSGGIGAGIIIADQLYRGAGGVAGELGHITVERDGLPCPCGKRGCLETVASGPAIVASARRVADHSGGAGLAAMAGASGSSITVESVARAAAGGDRLAQEILGSAADYLAMAISTLVCILDIGLVILGGEVAASGAVFFDPLARSLEKYQLYSNVATIVPARLGQDAALKGVTMLTLQHVLQLAD